MSGCTCNPWQSLDQLRLSLVYKSLQLWILQDSVQWIVVTVPWFYHANDKKKNTYILLLVYWATIPRRVCTNSKSQPYYRAIASRYFGLALLPLEREHWLCNTGINRYYSIIICLNETATIMTEVCSQSASSNITSKALHQSITNSPSAGSILVTLFYNMNIHLSTYHACNFGHLLLLLLTCYVNYFMCVKFWYGCAMDARIRDHSGSNSTLVITPLWWGNNDAS